MIEKRILVPQRLRRPPATGWSWVDRRFLREHGDHLSREAILLYLFLAAVADKHGLSFYSDNALSSRLRLSLPDLEKARQELLERDLIAHELPLVQVLSAPAPGGRRRAEPGQGLMMLGDILHRQELYPPTKAAVQPLPSHGGTCHERRLVGRNPPPRRDRQALRLGDRAAAALLAAHGGRCPEIAAAASTDRSTACQPARSVPGTDQAAAGQVSRPLRGAFREEIARTGYTGSASVLRRYLRKVRPARGRVYQEVHYQPAQALQVDWGECGRVQVGSTIRKVSVFVAVHCYSRLLYIEFTLSQRKAEFYRGLVNALTFFGGSPRNLIFDNLKAAVLNGSGRHAASIPSLRPCAAISVCSRSPAPAAIRNRKALSKEACAM